MNFTTVLKQFGTHAALARALGVSVQAVSRWRKTGKIPIRRQYELQALSMGDLRVGPTRPQRAVKNNNRTRKNFTCRTIDNGAQA